MKKIYLISLSFLSLSAFAQQDFFNPENKKEGLRYYKDKLYRGCSDLKEKQDPVSPNEVANLVGLSKKIVNRNFAEAFAENPKVKAAFEKDLDSLLTDPSCQREANDCRARLLGFSLFYYQTLRADIPECKSYKKSAPMEKGHNQNCEIELKLRKSSLQGVHGSNYGMPGPGMYKKMLIEVKNATTLELFNTIMQKDRKNLHICNSVLSGVVHHYALDLDEPGEYHVDLDPEHDPRKNMAKGCIDEKVTLYSEFVPTSFDEGRSTVGQDQVEPIESKISDFIKSHPEMIVTDVSVTSSSSKTPFHITVNGKKIIDPESNQKNLSLARERALFAEKVMKEIKSSNSLLSSVNFETKAELAGPDFEPIDLNDRFVTRMTPGYFERVEALYKKYQKEFNNLALKNSFSDLLDEKQFVNLYQAKFKPFHGFRVNIQGHIKEQMKCRDLSNSESSKNSGSSKQ
jgi:hypothetical protein